MTLNDETSQVDGFGLLKQAGFEVRDMLVSSAIGQRFRVVRESDGKSFLALVINEVWLLDARFREYYKNYADWSKPISNQQIATLYGVISDQRIIVYLYQDEYAFQSLLSVLNPNKTLFPDFVLRVLRNTISAMAVAADKGLIHGGLCLEAVRISPHGAVLIDDFFVLKSPQSMLAPISVNNGPEQKVSGHYFAPEHFTPNARCDMQTDMFVIGLLLYRMLIGKDCIVGSTPLAGMNDFLSREQQPLSTIRGDLVRQFDTLFQRLVTTEKNRRPQSYEEISSLIEHVEQAIRARELNDLQSGYTPFGNEIVESPARSTSFYRKPAPTTNRVNRETTTARRRIMANNVAVPAPPIVTGTETIRRLKPETYVAGSGTLIMAGLLIVLLAGYIIFTSVKNNAPAIVQAKEDFTQFKESQERQVDPTGKAPLHLAVTPEIDLSKIQKPSWMIPPNANSGVTPASNTVTESKADLVEVQSIEQLSLASIQLMRDGFFRKTLAISGQVGDADIRLGVILNVRDAQSYQREITTAQMRLCSSVEEAKNILFAAQKRWEMPGDNQWVKEQLALTQAVFASSASQVPLTQSGTLSVDYARKYISDEAYIDGMITESLTKGQGKLAEFYYAALPLGSPVASVNKRKCATWNNISAEVKNYFMVNPLGLTIVRNGNETSRVNNVTDEGLQLDQVEAVIPWEQLSAKEIASLASSMAPNLFAEYRYHEAAVICNLLANNIPQALQHVKTGKSKLSTQTLKDINLLINMHYQRELCSLADTALKAMAMGEYERFATAKTAILLFDQEQQPEFYPAIRGVFEGLSQIAGKPKSEVSEVKEVDKISFYSPTDLKAFTVTSGKWAIEKDHLINRHINSTLSRADFKDARSIHIYFSPLASNGRLDINFRGASLSLDLTNKVYRFLNYPKETRPASFIENTITSLHFDLMQPGNKVAIWANSYAEKLIDMTIDELTDQFELRADQVNLVAIDEIEIKRGNPSVNRDEQNKMRAIGLIPFGDAVIISSEIHLPKTTGESSGIAMKIPQDATGATFEAKGAGKLQLKIGNLKDENHKSVVFKILNNPLVFVASWSGNRFIISDESGLELTSVRLSSGDKLNHLFIMSLDDAVLLAPPRFTMSVK